MHEAQHDTQAIPDFTFVSGLLNRHEHHQLAEWNRRLAVTFLLPTLIRRSFCHLELANHLSRRFVKLRRPRADGKLA